MKVLNKSDDRSPEHPGLVSEESDEHFGRKGPEKPFISDNQVEDKPGDNSHTGACLNSRKRVQRFSDSDSSEQNQESARGYDNKTSKNELKSHVDTDNNENSSDSDAIVSKSQAQKSRIRKVSSDSRSDSDVNKNIFNMDVPSDNSQGSRIKFKKDKLQRKFKSLLTSRNKSIETKENDGKEVKGVKLDNITSDASDDEASCIEKIKKKIKDRTLHLKSTIYDPDTSDEESGGNEIKKWQKRPYKKGAKTTTPTAKPARMSAKQAMENMQKIKSESNRMLREKEVSLPYHRPKALSLKDIMSRRRPAVSADGKALPIKMNEDQLKQYALMLEQRQKEMMELCKSDTEEEEINENQNDDELSFANDKSYDTLIDNPEEELKGNFQGSMGINESEINRNSTKENCAIVLIENSNRDDNNSIENALVYKNKEASLKLDVNMTNKMLSNEETANVDFKNCQDSKILDCNASAEMELVYNGSVGDDSSAKSSNLIIENISTEDNNSNICTENDSQLIYLHLDSENTEHATKTNITNSADIHNPTIPTKENKDMETKYVSEAEENNEFPDDDDEDDIDMEDLDFLIENAEMISSQSKESAINSPVLVKDRQPLKMKPKLTGGPGMVIDLDGTDACAPKKSGVELLKERFTYFAKLKTPEELERAKEKKIKPGTQHLKLKHKLEELIAEQRSLEWTKRLEDERQQKMDIEAVIGDADDDCEDDIDKIEAKLKENEDNQGEESSENEDEELEDDCEIQEKPRKKNPLIDEEAEESDDNCAVNAQSDEEGNKGDDEGEEVDNDEDDDEEDSGEESSDEDNKDQSHPKKGRILKAFEDSDDEETIIAKCNHENKETINKPERINNTICNSEVEKKSPPTKNTEDDEIQLAQRHKSFSEDLFMSQESVQLDKKIKKSISRYNDVSVEDKTLLSQTFSISKSSNTQWYNTEPSDTQNNDEGNLDDVVGMCTGSFSQNLVNSQTETQKENATQDIGEDILALCTGKFYDNQFVSHLDSGDVTAIGKSEEIEKQHNDSSPVNKNKQSIVNGNKEADKDNKEEFSDKNNTNDVVNPKSSENHEELRKEDNNLLTSILDELNDSKFETTKPLKYFVGNEVQNRENKHVIASTQPKKRFVIDSDEEGNDNDISAGKRKHLKKKKLQDRALQISDDEEELEENYEDEYELEDESERVVEYDSEENEVFVQPHNSKKKKKASEFFEQEAELTSEDEWVGSGDEDEAGLDRMEREAGDDDSFHQGRLRRELEQIHMRDVLDQDKREVRLIQELLLEDGDLGGGHRQRKFRWKNAGGENEEATYGELLDTQEEELESEEQWRKQRHERETFLRQMKQQEEPDETIDISVTRTSLIKANLSSRTANNSIVDTSACSIADISATGAIEKKAANDIPSPKKPFTLFKQNYHGSLLTRGQGALARLAALALPLAGTDDDKPSVRPTHSGRNFVFTALSQQQPPKVTKRKADVNVGTPRLVKKMRTADSKKNTKNSLLDHLNT